ncbi:MAG: nucleotidyltransferase family protein [Lachnospiraceae bacterium]|nr:nucleotidyltransferase family protein [Lachnospiraceae bacterium]
MMTAGIIAEFNPFHNGHKYLIDRARAMGADTVVIVMSGDFVQSGEPAVCSKEIRTRMALECGADLVLLLPAVYSTASAEGFAYGAVSLLDSLGIVDFMVFGCETDDISALQKISGILEREPEEFKQQLKVNLANGLSFPRARANALKYITGSDEMAFLISSPNAILGIEYLKALKRLSSGIKPVAVKRFMAEHDSSPDRFKEINSASAIRDILENNDSPSLVSYFIPKDAFRIFAYGYGRSLPVFNKDLSSLIFPVLFRDNTFETEYADLNPHLKNRIQNKLKSECPTDLDEFIISLKTKNETYSHISRSLTHILLGIRKGRLKKCPYVRVLGVRRSSLRLLSRLDASCELPVITRLSKAEKTLSADPYALKAFRADSYAYLLYSYVLKVKFEREFVPEASIPVIIYDK